MTRPYAPGHRIPTDLLLKAYASGVFPMAESAADPGSVLGAAGNARHHAARRVPRPEKPAQDDPARTGSRSASTPTSKASSTAAPRPRADRRNTWINAPIREAYVELFRLGHCHTVEAWRDGRLVGGLYGVSLGRAFFGESMFSRERDASKVAWCIWSSGSRTRLHAARHAVHHRAPEAFRRGRRAAPQIREAAGKKRCEAEAKFCAMRRKHHVSHSADAFDLAERRLRVKHHLPAVIPPA